MKISLFMSARYATTYWLEMENLTHTHPWIHERVQEKGTWTVQRTGVESFSSVSADQAIEQTINRDSKTSGGIRGFTLTRGIYVIDSYLELNFAMLMHYVSATCIISVL